MWLWEDNWDDFGFKTMYSASLRTSGSDEDFKLGNVKILQRNQEGSRPKLSPLFENLNDDFCSIGQSIEYYEQLMKIPRDLRHSYLVALRDAAYDPVIEEAFEGQAGWNTSLLRFGEAVNNLKAGRELLHGNKLSTDRMSFQFEWRREGSTSLLPFEFDDSRDLPGRSNVLIGYNGVGKTTLLADLALAASSGRGDAGSNKSEISGTDTTFGAVVAISYSAFDTFKTPESILGVGDKNSNSASNVAFGYVYCGLRRQTSMENENFELKSIDEIQSEFMEALNAIGRLETREYLISAFQALAREPSFGQAGIDLTKLGDGINQIEAIAAFEELSTGHKIVLNIVTQLATRLRTRSLVLIDEPETHLHPPLVAALLRAIQLLLAESNSFAIIATHSPVVVQEMPSQFVRILERDGGPATLRQPEIETFAENIGSITRHVFSLDNSATDYQGTLRMLAKNHTEEEISEMFENGLSVQGRALVANYRNLQ
ncbi:ATP-binding protein [Rhodococcus erythropolis]|uniref:ATP-binding protein n=1 Tax=Rhodococcus qingshengii JCM 15477 TaxID=1303681 RepID=A0AB38RN40_RHOSG|nr:MULTISPECIES: AAA family ATPase [Rhodococcus]MCQ4128871.1 ATP-binding protein [Rhodococcus erythropolis]QSE44395.1 ATP-binding protein [Rhodococcus erythropolis]UPU46258.1 ATP-binding protein [Rhodococcus qingshengii JCM 15477]